MRESKKQTGEHVKMVNIAILAIILSSCGTESPTALSYSPIGSWQRQELGIWAGAADSSIIKYKIILGADSIGLWKMYSNDTLRKAVQGKWRLTEDTIFITITTCSVLESLDPIDCQLLPVPVLPPPLNTLRFIWDGEKISESYVSGYYFTRQ